MSIITLENAGWRKLCKKSGPIASGLKALCDQNGYQCVQSDEDFLVAPRSFNDLLYVHAEYNRDNFKAANAEYALGRIPLVAPSEFGSDVENPDKFVAAFVENPAGSVQSLHALSGVVTLCSNRSFPKLMATKVMPAFFEVFPEGRVHLIAVAPILLSLQAAMRVLSPMEIFDRAELQPLGALPARMASDTHSTLPENIGISTLETMLNFCFPQSFGIACTRLNCEVIFVFPQPIRDLGKFPRQMSDFARKSSVFHTRAPMEELQRYLKNEPFDEGKLLGRPVYQVKFDANDVGKLVNWAVKRANDLWSYMFDLTRHVEPKTGYFSALVQRKRFMTIERILIETALIISEREPHIRKTLFFNLHDKYASLMAKPGDMKERLRVFNRLLKKSHFERKLVSKLRTIPEPFLSFVQDSGKRAFEAVFTEVIDDVWLKSRVGNKVVSVRQFDGDPTPEDPTPKFSDVAVDDETYVCRVIHGFRNSLHGYFLAHYGFEEDLALSQGHIPDALPEFAWIFAFLLLEDPAGLCEAEWKETA